MEGLTAVMGKLARPQRYPVDRRADQMALELQAAKEILAEVFRIKMTEVDEMILSRLDEATIPLDRPEGNGLWPREFRLEDG
ncbi:hypothetical protein [Methanothrix sp.]|uniref:hypothetical protein n=1 Tax=Methanothrix sp. TaxID=90426 RepID=UPI003C78835B